MKHLFRKTLYLAVIFLIIGLVLFAYDYTARNLRSFVAGTLEKSFGAKLSIAHMRMSFPLCLELKGVKINNTITVSKLYIYPSPASAFLKKTFIFSSVRIVEPVVKIKAGESDNVAYFKALTAKDASVVPSKDSKAVFYISRIDIENGSFFYDTAAKNNLGLVKINGSIKGPHIYLTGNTPFSFKALGFIKNQGSEEISPVRITGLVTRSGIIKAKLQASNVSITALGPLHEKYLKDKINTGIINLDSRVVISKNSLKADCFCRINDVILKDKAQKFSMPVLASFMLDFDFRNNALKINNLQTNLLSLVLNRS